MKDELRKSNELWQQLADQAPAHWLYNEDIILSDSDEMTELFQTGSVTTTIAGRKYVVSLLIQEEQP